MSYNVFITAVRRFEIWNSETVSFCANNEFFFLIMKLLRGSFWSTRAVNAIQRLSFPWPYHNRFSFKVQGVCILNLFKRSFWCLLCRVANYLMFSARNFTKSVWTPNKLFYIVCIDFMALRKYNRSLCKFSCSIRSDACCVLKT